MCNTTMLKEMKNLYCVDDTPAKRGCVVPGTEIPVGGWDLIEAVGAKKAILLSWNYRESMVCKLIETGFRGQLLIPFPEIELLEI
jgi:hypothetical protein